MAKLTQSEVEAYLGRSLTSKEATNFNNNYDTAQEILESLLCISLDTRAENAPAETYEFDARDGYSTVFTGIFETPSDVKVNGATTTDYTSKFWDNRNTTTYNSIVFDKPLRHKDTVAVTALWGYETLPNDLGWLLSQMIALVGSKYSTKGVKSKRVEDFSITYMESTEMEQYIDTNAVTINKYSMCHISEFRSGRVCRY